MKNYKDYLKFLHSVAFSKKPDDDDANDARMIIKVLLMILFVIASLIGPLFLIGFLLIGYVSDLFVIVTMTCWAIFWVVFILGYFVSKITDR